MSESETIQTWEEWEDDLMDNEEHENFFGEMKPAPDELK